jgi:putative FmdB family regulatory protein
MPIYDFICDKCGEKFDRLVGFDWQKAGITCPSCGGSEIIKAVSLVGAFQSGGKIQSLGGKSGCAGCSTGTCSTCH